MDRVVYTSAIIVPKLFVHAVAYILNWCICITYSYSYTRNLIHITIQTARTQDGADFLYQG